MDKIQMLPKLAELSGFFPKTVKKAPCQEVVLTGEQVDLAAIPILKCWPADGGRFITLPMVCTVDPVTRITNVGMYRMQVYDHQTTGMHWHKHKDGARHYQHYEAAGKRMEAARRHRRRSLDHLFVHGAPPARHRRICLRGILTEKAPRNRPVQDR